MILAPPKAVGEHNLKQKVNVTVSCCNLMLFYWTLRLFVAQNSTTSLSMPPQTAS